MAFNGAHYRQQPIPDVVREFQSVREKRVLVVATTSAARILNTSPGPEGLLELGKKFNLLKDRDFRASVRRIQRHNILVVGSFITGLDIDEPGIGKRIAEVASHNGNECYFHLLPGLLLKISEEIPFRR